MLGHYQSCFIPDFHEMALAKVEHDYTLGARVKELPAVLSVLRWWQIIEAFKEGVTFLLEVDIEPTLKNLEEVVNYEIVWPMKFLGIPYGLTSCALVGHGCMCYGSHVLFGCAQCKVGGCQFCSLYDNTL